MSDTHNSFGAGALKLRFAEYRLTSLCFVANKLRSESSDCTLGRVAGAHEPEWEQNP
jgi:hypothetical protein